MMENLENFWNSAVQQPAARSSTPAAAPQQLAATNGAGDEIREESARVEVRARMSRIASPGFWQTCLANCWREFLSLICQNL